MRSAAALLSVLLCASASAQVSEVIEVRVTNIDVVVTDRAGKPVTGLTKDDFQLFENGKLQPITNFYEIRADVVPAAAAPDETQAPPPVPAEMRRRSILIFIDNFSVPQFRRNQAVQAVRRGLDRLLRPGDDAMIVVWNRNPEVVQPFTADRELLNRAVDGLDKRLAGAPWLEQQKGMVLTYAQNALTRAVSTRGRYPIAQAYSDSIASWRPYAEMIMKLEKAMLTSTAQMVSTLAGTESKKVCIFIGGQMPDQPGIEVLQMINSTFQSAGYNGIIAAVPGGTEFSVTDELRKLAHLANASGVAMYMIDVSDRMKDSSGGMGDSYAEFIAESSSVLSMGAIASATGGSVLSGTKNFDLALNNLARDLGSYYSLGYKPSVDGPVDRRVSVKVSRAGAVVRSRQAYSMKTADEQMEEKVVANVFHGGGKSDFEVSIEAGKPEPFEGHFKIPVKLTFSSDLTYVPDGGELTGGFAVFFVTASDAGALSQVSKQEQTVRFPAASYFSIKEKPFTHTATLLVRPGRQSVSIAVVDKLGGRAGYATATVDAK